MLQLEHPPSPQEIAQLQDQAAKAHQPRRQRGSASRKPSEPRAVAPSGPLQAWYDTRFCGPPPAGHAILSRIAQTIYSGVVLYLENARAYSQILPGQTRRIVHLNDERELAEFLNAGILPEYSEHSEWVIASAELAVIEQAKAHGLPTCLRAYVTDAETLERSIEQGRRHPYLIVGFRDPTNIPLELVIASLQTSGTVLIKEIGDPNNIDDAIVSLGVLEVGADGVMFSPADHELLDRFIAKLQDAQTREIKIEGGTVLKNDPIGMGHRSCIDTVTIFSPKEGMLIGSTSQGAVLCCPEVFFLPYMELRPFRVNAGGVHSYVYGADNRTNYMTELRAGAPITIVGLDGKIRQAPVGRIKTEIRPLRLIEVEFAGGERVNVIMQDDWHVRIFSEDGLPINITDLRPGDRVLGHVANPGRHVGIKVDETIIEA